MDIADIMDIVGIVDIVDIGESAEYTRPLRRIHSVPVRHYCSPCAVNGWVLAEYTRPFRRIHSPAEYIRIPPNTLEWVSNLRKCSAEYTRMLAEYTQFFAEYIRISPNTFESPECIQQRMYSNQFFLQKRQSFH